MDKSGFGFKCTHCIAVFCFVFSIVLTDLMCITNARAAVFGLPEPGSMLAVSQKHTDPLLRGLKVDYDNPLNFQFIFDTADEDDVTQDQARMMINYFFAALAVPDESLWVNLSPYEADRVIEASLGQTDLGRDMLAQDYVLKQLSSSLTHPDTESGEKYWSGINNSSSIMHNSETGGFSKIWITPDIENLEVMEGDGFVWVARAGLTAQTEADYLAMQKSSIGANSRILPDSSVMAEGENMISPLHTILPSVINEINNGSSFSSLRQMYNAMILAMWFKKRFKESFYSGYIDKQNVRGIDIQDKSSKDKIFDLYRQAFEEGAYNVVRRERLNGQTHKRRYTSGGIAGMDKVSSALEKPGILKKISRYAAKITAIGALVAMIAGCEYEADGFDRDPDYVPITYADPDDPDNLFDGAGIQHSFGADGLYTVDLKENVSLIKGDVIGISLGFPKAVDGAVNLWLGKQVVFQLRAPAAGTVSMVEIVVKEDIEIDSLPVKINSEENPDALVVPLSFEIVGNINETGGDSFKISDAGAEDTDTANSALEKDQQKWNQGGLAMQALGSGLEDKFAVSDGTEKKFNMAGLPLDVFSDGIKYKIFTKRFVAPDQVLAMAE